MAETKLASTKNDAVPVLYDRMPWMKGAPSQAAASPAPISSNPLRTIWDSALDEVTATVFAELRF